ncbi:hypothetical protein PRK78_000054 [Emydomyces testavorans]|uniref:MYND-type domain-containing protein n=1 Tax=Emydomyces testavorans TaxID=2070801 RepID=A0AAF0DAQ7_9EURO|nr:hypothetical protein PRK78_000054 [Emydomyces testavorans]
MANSKSKTAILVDKFNALTRPMLTSFHLPNHYHFTVKPLPLNVPGEGVYLVNPYNGHDHFEGRTRITALSPAEQAKIIVPLLLESFVTRFDTPGPIYEMHKVRTAWAPWSWSTTDATLALAVSARLRALGVRSELHKVLVSDFDQVQTAEAQWQRWKRDFESVANPALDEGRSNVDKKCATCGFTPSLDQGLQRCGRCKRISYCSRDCQKADWRQHKVRCNAPAT